MLIPTLVVVAGAGLDLGWYYLNVSRMQNAADAAVIAGANSARNEEQALNDYNFATFADHVPQRLLDPPVRYERGKETADRIAQRYVKKNLAGDSTENATELSDSYTKDDVTFTSELWGDDREDYNSLYYQVWLEEDVDHFFLKGFSPMKAKVSAIAKIAYYRIGENLFVQTERQAKLHTENKRSWIAIRDTLDIDGNPYGGDKANSLSVLSTGNWYDANDPNTNKYRTETLQLNGLGGKNALNTTGDTGDAGKYGEPDKVHGSVDQKAFDALFIDWETDLANRGMKNNWDVSLAQEGIKTGTSDESFATDVSSKSNWTFGYNEQTVSAEDRKRRIHGVINVSDVYLTYDDYDGTPPWNPIQLALNKTQTQHKAEYRLSQDFSQDYAHPSQFDKYLFYTPNATQIRYWNDIDYRFYWDFYTDPEDTTSELYTQISNDYPEDKQPVKIQPRQVFDLNCMPKRTFSFPVRDREFYFAYYSSMKKDYMRRKYDKDDVVANMAKSDAKTPYSDVLYARIESEPINDSGNVSSSVHQIIINVNNTNTNKYQNHSGDFPDYYPEAWQATANQYTGQYCDRAIFFYYTGPEKDMSGGNAKEGMVSYEAHDGRKTVRDSLPVIINLNEDFRGIFFFPNSPVVINGNNHNFKGYIIAKEYVQLLGKDDLLYNAAKKVYYDRNTLVKAKDETVADSDDFQAVTYYDSDGTTHNKYLPKSLLEEVSQFDFTEYKNTNTFYKSDEMGTAEHLAEVSGNGKVEYYSYSGPSDKANEKDLDEYWTTKVGEGYFDRSNEKSFVYFPASYVQNKSWHYSGVWKAKSVSDGQWLNEKEEYLDRYLVNHDGDKVKMYDTAEAFLTALGGYSKLDDDGNYVKDGASSYMAVESGKNVYYVPKDTTFFNGDDPVPETITNKLAKITYNDDGDQKVAYADLSSGTVKEYYLTWQKDADGNDVNPMLVDEWGNVQYKRDSEGNYITIEPSINALESLDLELLKSLILEGDAELTERFSFLLEQSYFDKDAFNLASSTYDDFNFIHLVQYGYLKKNSIDNIFTVKESKIVN